MTAQAKPPVRVGLYGGAFDPPHLAHQALVRAAIEQLPLGRLLIMPTGHAWHKQRPLTAAVHRLAMARLAFAQLQGAFVDDRETRRSGPSYTIDTLAELQAEWPGHVWCLLIGEDQLEAFCQWHRWRDILQLAQLVVARRGDGAAPLQLPWQGTQAGHAPPERPIELRMPRMPHSSTAIRAALARAEPAQALVGDDVARYIAQHHLYQTD